MDESLDTSLAVSTLELILARHGIAFARLDCELRVREASSNLAAFLEGEPRSLVGASLPDLWVEFFGMEDLLKAILRGEAQELHLAPIARELPTGTTRYLSFEVSRLEDNAALPGLLLVEDITPYGELEQHLIQDRNEMRLLRAELVHTNAELQRLNQFKSTILAMTAHDLRSPLSALLLQLSVLLRNVQAGQPPAAWLERIRWMQYTAGKMKNLIADLLDLEQAERGRLVLHPARCDLVALIQHLASTVPPDAVHRIELEVPAEGLVIVADSERLQQVFYNLVENALKYTPSHQRVTVAIRHQDEWALVEVRDRGNGIASEELPQLFQMYYRTREAQQGAVAGKGLGLFIVRTLVEAHGGRVEVRCELDQGTTFSVYLPVNGPAPAEWSDN